MVAIAALAVFAITVTAITVWDDNAALGVIAAAGAASLLLLFVSPWLILAVIPAGIIGWLAGGVILATTPER